MRINGREVEHSPGETVLQAALRNGVGFPNSCRVGGCGTCRCKLVSGEVKELTESGYLLTREEVDQRFILACQSVPTSVDVAIEVKEHAAITGVIVAQEKLTHDITRVSVKVNAALPYTPGQYTNVQLDGESRSYSFSTAAQRDDGVVQFIVRRVPGGTLSPRLCDEDLAGREVRLDGAHGDFWLRESDAPLLFVAGGSGLAPILSVLHAARAAGVTRDVTLLFGAREARDLYALDELEALRAAWPAKFELHPILSASPEDSDWRGARGLVTEKLPEVFVPEAHAYLCGPPAMIDAAVEQLQKLGLPRARIHFDRFTTRADAPAATVNAGFFDYAKYSLFHLLGLTAVAGLALGGATVAWTFAFIVGLYTIGDALSGSDTRTPLYRFPRVLTWQCWAALPLLALTFFVAMWSVAPTDTFGFGAWLTQLTGFDFLAARAATTFAQHVAGWALTGLMIGVVGTITAHELTHRTWDRVSLFIGRWLLAFSFDTSFAIEHVYGHHRYVSTVEDPATAPRGRSVYAHMVISTLRGNASAWRIEKARLEKKRLGVFSLHNAFLRGHAMSVALLMAAFLIGGWRSLGFFIACGLWGKALLEIVNYMEHYGMVRDPATPVQPRHSWNSNQRLSSWTTFNLTRHSHHHAQGEVPFHELQPSPEQPMMISGYLSVILLTLIPPLWQALMLPRVLAWDRDYATPEERRLAHAANARSGLTRLRALAPRG